MDEINSKPAINVQKKILCFFTPLIYTCVIHVLNAAVEMDAL